MISLSHLNKSLFFLFFFIALSSISAIAEDETIDIWEKKDSSEYQSNENEINKKNKIKNSILSESENKFTVEINEKEIKDQNQSVIGIFDPEKNNFNLNMWSVTDGNEIKKVLKRINKLKLSKLSEDLLFQILFTNAYPPNKNLNSEEFLKIKINWLINKKRINDLENVLKKNPEVGKYPKAIKFLLDEYLSSADSKSACAKTKFIDKKVKNSYLQKFIIYCLIEENQKEEAQIIFDLLIEGGFEDKFFEDKMNYLLGIKDDTLLKLKDDNLLNLHLSHITDNNFKYEPNEKTDKYIWKYLSSANLVEVNNFENENVILTYEQAASENSFEKDEIFKIYLKMNFNFNQLANSENIYKSLPSFKARGLIYQSILLSDNYERKIKLAFLLKNLFIKDKIFNVYIDELSTILESIDPKDVPEGYTDLINKNLKKNSISQIKFDNDILHRSKVIKHFLDNNEKLNRTEKDFKSVYKKIKRNKKYFISIKDIIVLESLLIDGISLPKDLEYNDLTTQLTVPKNLEDLVSQNQLGLVMLKLVEIIGEDDVRDLDPETLYFITKILNNLKLKKIRNNILKEALPARI